MINITWQTEESSDPHTLLLLLTLFINVNIKRRLLTWVPILIWQAEDSSDPHTLHESQPWYHGAARFTRQQAEALALQHR